MVKDIRYIIKRILIGVGIALVLMALKGNLALKVSARTISMSTPDTFGYYTVNGQSTQNTISSQQATSGTLSDIPVYISQLVPQNSHGGMAYEWTNANLCVNDDLTVSGVLHAPTITNITWTSGYFNSWSEMKSCSFYKSGNNAYRFTCSGTGGGGFVVYFGFQMDRSYGGFLYLERDLDIYCNATANDIITNANNNTTELINNANENTQEIKDAINQANQETIESQKVCNDKKYVYSDLPSTNSGFLTGAYTSYNASNWRFSDYIKVSEGEVIVSSNQNVSSAKNCFYDSSYSSISCYLSNSGTTVVPSGASYVRFNIYNNSANYTIVRSCLNGNQAIADGQKDINDSLNDDTGVSNNDISSWFSDFSSSSSMTPVSDLLTLPITLINAYISGMSGTCQSINLGELYGSYLILPCINLQDYLGSDLWSLIDTIFSLYLIYNIAMLFITAFDNLTSLKDDFSSLYGAEGRHIGSPTRVERNSDLY